MLLEILSEKGWGESHCPAKCLTSDSEAGAKKRKQRKSYLCQSKEFQTGGHAEKIIIYAINIFIYPGRSFTRPVCHNSSERSAVRMDTVKGVRVARGRWAFRVRVATLIRRGGWTGGGVEGERGCVHMAWGTLGYAGWAQWSGCVCWPF